MARIRFRRLLSAALAATLIVTAACTADDSGSSRDSAVAVPVSPTAQTADLATPPAASAQVTRAAPTEVEPDAALAFSHIHKLADEIGPRPSGTEEEHRAAQYIASVLRDYGYDVELQRFAVSTWVSRAVSLRVDPGIDRPLEAQSFTNSRPGTAAGQLVAVGRGRPEDFPASVRGNIALIERGDLTFQEKAANAAVAGASAVVIYNNVDGALTGDLRDGAPAIPVLAIAGEAGRALQDRLKSGPVGVALAFDGGRVDSDSYNVVARSPGTRCQSVLGGHYDTVPGAPGASDNASGTAAVIEMARVQSLRGNPEHACFVAFASEETGLDGSRFFVSLLSADDKKALRFMLNFDMVAFGTEWLLIGPPAMQEQGRAIMKSMGIDSRFIVPLGFSSDHASFNNAGIPGLFLHRSNDSLLHTPQDVSGRLSVDQLGEAMRIGLAFLRGINPA